MADDDKTETQELPVDPIAGPLVFISHDARDADLAEAFGKLLSSVSAGMLKSFRSSDRTGSQGFEFGTEWYPELMRKLRAACDVVCLLTPRSIDRPWILYEAGVAKGKLDAPVHGVALGIPLTRAGTGPFAEFHNCDNDSESLTKLVTQLVKRLPAADPDVEMVTAQVEHFRDQVTEIMGNQTPDEIMSANDPAAAAKAFEEIKIMFKDLPARIESAGDSPSRRDRRLRDPRIMEELMMMTRRGPGDPLGLVLALSVVHDDFPWMYDLAVELYRASIQGDSAMARRIALDLRESSEAMMHGPGRRFLRRERDGMILMEILEHMMGRLLTDFEVAVDLAVVETGDERPS